MSVEESAEGPQTGRSTRASGRTPWGTLSRQRVVEAAGTLLAEQGLDGLTIRGLAARLGVAPMTLYGHVRDKDDLLDEVVDRLVSETWEPATDPGDPVAWLLECADRLRALLVEQPAALHVYLHRPALSPSAVRRMEGMVAAVRSMGATDDEARAAFGAIQTYTVGFAALQAARSGYLPPSDDEQDLAHRLARLTSGEQFAAGLGFLVAGIRQALDGADVGLGTTGG